MEVDSNTKRPNTMNLEHLETKKPKTVLTENLTAKQKKKAAKARKLGLSYELDGSELVIHPKIFLKPFNDFCTMKDARNLLLTALSPSGKQARLADIPDFPGVKQIKHTILMDVPIFDPYAMGLPLEARQLSKKETPELYAEFKAHPLFKYIDQSQGEEDDAILGLVSAAGFDQYKRVHDRFLDVLQVPLSKSALKQKREEEDKDPEQKHKITPEELVMTTDVLKIEDYPIHTILDPSSELDQDWVDTLPGKNESKEKKLVALDCEMCKTVNGYAVTRVALIDRDNNVLIDEFVKPGEEITDYVTHISGVNEASLKHITTTLADIQKKIQLHVDGDTILVGHGLVNDMKCLKMRHPYIIDTAVIYHHKNGPPYKPSLRDLTTRYLKRSIQIRDQDKKVGDILGHDPCEDAVASLELVERKLQFGHNYGLAGLSQVETILDSLKRTDQAGVVIEHNANLSLLMKRALTENNLEDYFAVESDDQVATKVIENMHKDLVIARFDLPQLNEQERQDKFMSLFTTIYEQMKPDTAFCITTGYRSNAEREGLREKRVEFKKKLKKVGLTEIPMEERWSIEEEHQLEEIADKTRRGFVFAAVKNTDE